MLARGERNVCRCHLVTTSGVGLLVALPEVRFSRLCHSFPHFSQAFRVLLCDDDIPLRISGFLQVPSLALISAV